jgi:CRISPR-associated protein Cas1
VILMTTLYVKEQGAVLRRTGERLVVTKDREVLEDVPILHVEQVVIMGNVQLTTPATALLLQKDIDVVFLSSYGKFRGRLMTTGSRFARLRHAQLQYLADEQAVLALAQAIVAGKLRNQAALLRRLPGARSLGSAVQTLDQVRRRARQATDLDSLRGYEGTAGASYFGALRTQIPQTWGFTRRIYHPPPDPVNAMLSLGYTLILKDITAAVQLVGLDPFLGFFHALDYGRPSLCLDLMEAFRPLVDGMVFQLIHDQRIQEGEFKPTEKNGKDAVLLEEPALQRYLRVYEQLINQRFRYPQTGEHTPLRRCMELQTRELAQVMLRKRRRFVPFTVDQ